MIIVIPLIKLLEMWVFYMYNFWFMVCMSINMMRYLIVMNICMSWFLMVIVIFIWNVTINMINLINMRN